MTADKLGMLATTYGAWQHDIVPKPILGVMVAKHLTNSAATLYNGIHDEQKRSIRPPKSGKYSMAADNIAIGAFLIADELERGTDAYKAMRAVGYVATAVGLAFGIDATTRYVHGDFDTDPSLDNE